jgi:hypothetical protein
MMLLFLGLAIGWGPWPLPRPEVSQRWIPHRLRPRIPHERVPLASRHRSENSSRSSERVPLSGSGRHRAPWLCLARLLPPHLRPEGSPSSSERVPLSDWEVRRLARPHLALLHPSPHASVADERCRAHASLGTSRSAHRLAHQHGGTARSKKRLCDALTAEIGRHRGKLPHPVEAKTPSAR